LSRTRIRTFALCIGIALIVGLAIPARNRLRLGFGLERAHTAVRDRRFGEALELLNALDRDHPQRKDVCYMLGVAHRRLGQFDQSFEYLQQAEKLGWPLSDVTRQRYLARFQAGDIESTKGYLYTLLQEGVDDVVAEEIYETLAEGYLKQARIVDSIVVLNHWIEWQPHAVQARLWRAQMHETFEEDWIASAEHYRKILETIPSHSEARLRLANALFKSQKVEEALKEYLAIRQDSPEHPLALLGLARCKQRLGNSSDAVKLFEAVTTADIDDSHRAQAWAELGQIALNNSDYKRAVECFESGLEADPRQVKTHNLLGTTYSRLGEDEKARHHIELSQHVLKQNQRMSELADEITKNPTDTAPRIEMAKVVEESGDLEAAMRWLQTVIHIDPTHAEARETLANLFSELGIHDVAAAHRRFATQPAQVDTPTKTE
jgi:tetratricopeptide (TPR) repeat protein